MVENTQRRGLMLVISSPSGAGKSTLARRLLADDPAIHMSVSATTRPPRKGELDGTDYYFMDQNEFDTMVARGGFLEHATVFGNSYGTPEAPVMDALQAGRDVLFDIDWQGTQQLGAHPRDDLVKIFILPPTIAELEDRLKGRGQDSEAVVASRMAEATNEISHWAEYDYVLINDDLDECYAALQNILDVERRRIHRQPGLASFARGLMSKA